MVIFSLIPLLLSTKETSIAFVHQHMSASNIQSLQSKVPCIPFNPVFEPFLATYTKKKLQKNTQS